jgi:hypothetical protein
MCFIERIDKLDRKGYILLNPNEILRLNNTFFYSNPIICFPSHVRTNTASFMEKVEELLLLNASFRQYLAVNIRGQ